MLSFLLDLLSNLAHIGWDILSFLAHSAMELLSGIASLLAWPIRTVLSTLGNWLGWTPLFFLGFGVLLLLLLVLAGWAVASNRRRKYHR